MPDKIAIVGTGLVGSAWAIVFARAGHRVALYDGTEGQCEAAIARIETNLAALEGHGLIDDPAPRGRVFPFRPASPMRWRARPTHRRACSSAPT